MQAIFDTIIIKPMGWILHQLSNMVGGNFALAVFLFTVVINMLLIPLSIKSQQSTSKQAQLKPKVDALQKKYAKDKVKLNEEMTKLYREENVSMTGGCLTLLIRMPFLMGIYYAVINPLSYLVFLPKDIIDQAKTACAALMGVAADKVNTVTQLDILSHVHQLEAQFPDLAQAKAVDFSLFGLDLTQRPVFSLNIFSAFQPIWIIPILSFGTAMITSLISMRMQKRLNPDAPNMAGMMLTMPLISLVLAFTVPGAVGFYWACSNLVAGTIQTVLQHHYSANKIIAKEQAKRMIKQFEEEDRKIKTAGSAAE